MAMNFGIGVTTGSVLVVRAGMQGKDKNDLVWVGDSVNMAVKLSSYSKDGENLLNQHYVFVSGEISEKISDLLKYPKNENTNLGAFSFSKSIWIQAYPPRSEGAGLIGVLIGQNKNYKTKHYIKPSTEKLTAPSNLGTVAGLFGVGNIRG